MNQLPKRLKSIDIFRAITMLLMIFVNDVSSVKQIPSWIEHAAASEDGLGFADTVFPAFLFIVGLSLPFAIRNRMNKDDSVIDISVYILSRSVALLVMGFFHVNSENYNSAAVLPQAIWIIAITIAFFLIWLDYPPAMAKIKKYILITTGIILLLLMAFLYKGGTPAAPEGLRPSWWGILGIIGWAYMVCAFLFLFIKGSLPVLLIALILFMLVNIIEHAGSLKLNLPVIGDASSVTLVMWGIVISLLYGELSAKGKDQYLWLLFLSVGMVLIIGGLIIRPFAGGISKIHSTPAWVFICTGISVLIFTFMIWLVDIKGKQNWFTIIRPAGTSTLTCYLIPYLLYSIYSLLHFHYPEFLNYGTGGLIRSIIVAVLVIILVGVMEKRTLRLKI